ncbi:pre-mRNA-splicing factor 38A isoform X1 [Stegostoma tigrinum]|uniref:pre-mRNA-splicing factor 38A isoform X1 n=1 Tax=Stegostoma tigrinum TaxID=3053191 RepID=UPI00202B0CB0|nr:pre-mRNA-splicing factor 38A isoform X1 [Stegostoma tigrinum]
MANRTVKDAHSIHGTNPQYLIEKIIRTRIYESKYWKEECFGLTAELVVDKAMELKYIGGVYGGNIKPSPFLCLTLKMLQIQPEKDIIVEFIKNEDFKYVRLLGALYMRLTGSAIDCYKYLEPLYNDYRKVKRQKRDGEFELIHVDEFMDELLHEERVCDIILPRLQKRYVLEEAEMLDTRVSALEEDMDDVDTSEDEDEDEDCMLIISRVTEFHHQSLHDVATVILIGLEDHHLHDIEEVEAKHQDDEAGPPSEEVHHRVVKDIVAKVLDVIVVVLEIVVTDQDPNLQVITEATDTEVILNHLRDQRRVTRKVEEEMSEVPYNHSNTFPVHLKNCL